jgi:DNA-binding response OmpR family regulator
VIVCSGKGGIDDKRRAFDWGACAYVEKPFEFEELVREVTRAVERARAHESATGANTLPLPVGNPELA